MVANNTIRARLQDPTTPLILDEIVTIIMQNGGSATLSEMYEKIDESRLGGDKLRMYVKVGVLQGRLQTETLRRGREIVYTVNHKYNIYDPDALLDPNQNVGTIVSYILMHYGRTKATAAQFASALAEPTASIRRVPDLVAGIIGHIYMRSWIADRGVGVRELKAPIPSICRDELISAQDAVENLLRFISQLLLMDIWDDNGIVYKKLHWNDDMFDEMEELDRKYREDRRQ